MNNRHSAPLGFEFGGVAPSLNEGFDEGDLMYYMAEFPQNYNRWQRYLRPGSEVSDLTYLGFNPLPPGSMREYAETPELADAAEREYDNVRNEILARLRRESKRSGYSTGGNVTSPQQDKGFDEAELVRRLSLPENVDRWNKWLPEVDASSYAKIGSGFLKPGTFRKLAPVPELADAAENEFNHVQASIMSQLREERKKRGYSQGGRARLGYDYMNPARQ